MKNLDIIKKAENILPDSFKSATIISNGKPILLFDYLENGFINYLKPGAEPEIVVQCIYKKLSFIQRCYSNRPQIIYISS